jgi:hypothetical protein
MMIDFWVSAFWTAGHVVVIAASLVTWAFLWETAWTICAREVAFSRLECLLVVSNFIINAAIFRHYWLML